MAEFFGGKENTHGVVLQDNGDSFGKFMKMKKLVPAMVKKKILEKNLGKVIKKTNDSELLLGNMMQMSLDDFIGYLEVLIDLGSSEPAGTEEGTRAFMRIMAGSLEKMKQEPGSKLEQTITRFMVAAFTSSTQTKQTQTQLQSHSSETQLLDTQTKAETQLTSADVLSTTEVVAVDSSSTDHSTIETPTKLEEKLQHKFDSTAEMETGNPTTVNPTSAAPKRPPAGQIGDAVGGFFTSDGGMLYSPIHGVSLSIPPNAVPAKSMCYLGMHFYLGGPFVLADGVVSCSIVVWFYQSHYFEFLEDVTVKIPHAAKVDVTNGGDDKSLCVLTWGEDKQGPNYKLSKEVAADFSDGYHAVFKVRHFCPKVVAKKSSNSKSKNASKTVPRRSRSQSKNRKRAGSNISKGVGRMNSDSLEKSFDECTTLVTPPIGRSGSHDGNGSTESCISESLTRQDAMDIDLPSTSYQTEERDESGSRISYSIARLMPADRSGTKWEVTFAACYNHPTGNWVLRMCGKNLFRKDLDFKRTSFRTCRDYLEFIPLEWKGDSNSWRVDTTEANVITTEDIQCVPSDSSKPEFKELIASGLYPPIVTYSVECDANPPDGRLNCRIEVEGAETANGKPPFFVLTSSVRKQTKCHTDQERILYTSSYLYGEDSDIKKALNSPNSDICLNFRKPEHKKFLADISFQITDAPPLRQALGLQDYPLHSAESGNANINLVCYSLLAKWACSKGRDARLSVLKDALSTIGYRDILLRDYHDTTATNKGGADLLISPHFDSIPLPTFSPSLSSSSDIELNFLRVLTEKLQCCWRSIGHLMGIPDLDLDTVAMEHPPPEPLHEQSYHMIYKWQRKNANKATYGILFKAIKCLFDRSLDSINDAYCYAMESVEQLLVECHVVSM